MPRFEPNPARRPSIVTGASSGIGAATAVALAGAGHPVALGARRVERCEEAAERIRAAGGEAVALPLDVGDDESVRKFVAAAVESLGPIEILVSGAGGLAPSPIHELDSETFAEQVGINLVGAHRLVSAVVPDMVGRRRGDVVFVGSDVVPAPRPGMGGYVAAKSGLEAMAYTMRMELEGTGVRASIVRPGPTVSDLAAGWDQQATLTMLESWQQWGFARHPYFLRASDIAAAVTTVVSAPRGVHLTLVEVQPEAPLREVPDA
ncbi:SDR family oxidoreductase [Actinophytocola sp.]|uniref:SDR family oxidoreductase n=1 Tax=Actinophytocola sp. TaxID=1872138 RepID=UPI002D56059E|nr:SDR family oxidoreductase [Actinophytocola sp.]HYQ66969.1 SDR family oxidoreductase [Actinophytocola sp.]